VSLQKGIGFLLLKQWYCFLATILISQLINVLYDKMKSKKTTIRQVAFDLQRASLQVKIDLKNGPNLLVLQDQFNYGKAIGKNHKEFLDI
jgi:hypothetical protein